MSLFACHELNSSAYSTPPEAQGSLLAWETCAHMFPVRQLDKAQYAVLLSNDGPGKRVGKQDALAREPGLPVDARPL